MSLRNEEELGGDSESADELDTLGSVVMWFVCPTLKILKEGGIMALLSLDRYVGNNPTEEFVKKIELFSNKWKSKKLENILCSQNLTCWKTWKYLEIGSQQW